MGPVTIAPGAPLSYDTSRVFPLLANVRMVRLIPNRLRLYGADRFPCRYWCLAERLECLEVPVSIYTMGPGRTKRPGLERRVSVWV